MLRDARGLRARETTGGIGPPGTLIGYRSDIDGLRAIAVLSVVFFHAGIEQASGGFVGVDVFFVISGYLICTLIIDQTRRGTFVFRKFWLRRVRRLFPALFVVMSVAAIAFYFVYPPNYYREFGQSLVAQSFFFSNVFFFLDSDYFAAAAETKPLLHTWSLSVEEQFYLLFPAFIYFGLRRGRSWLARVGIPVVLVSFLLSIGGGYFAPTAGFYLLPTRIWQLGIGAILAFLVARNQSRREPSATDEWIALGGLVCIALAVVRFDNDTPFPSYTAALPCLGAAGIIWANRWGMTRVGTALSFQPLVFIGLVSYSLYLWHWVALVFNRALHPLPPSLASNLATLALAGIVSVLSYLYVERPVRRNPALFTNRRLFVGALSGSGALITIGAAIALSDGMPWRLDPSILAEYDDAIHITAHKDHCHRAFDERPTDFMCASAGLKSDSTPPLVVWGDSHALSLLPVLERASETTGMEFAFATYGGCPSVWNMRRVNRRRSHQCREFNDAVLHFVSENRVRSVLLISRFSTYIKGNDLFERGEKQPFITNDSTNGTIDPRSAFREFKAEFSSMVDELVGAGVKVFVVLDVPNMNVNVSDYFLKMSILNEEPTYRRPRAEIDERIRELRDFLESQDVVLLDFTDHFCSENHCPAFEDGVPLYRDDDHLSVFGAMTTLPVFEDLFRQIQRRSAAGAPAAPGPS